MKRFLLISAAATLATSHNLRQHRSLDDPEPTPPSLIDPSNVTESPLPIQNQTATEIITAGLEQQITQYEIGCESANAVLYNATAAFNVTRDDILAAMNEVTLAIGDAHDATQELLKGTEDAAPEADVLNSLTVSQAKSAHARSMRNKLNALTKVKVETEFTTKEACNKLDMAKKELISHLRQEYASKRKIYEAVKEQLTGAKRQLHSHLVQAKGDAADAQAAQEQGTLPGPIVTQKVLVVEKAVRAAKASKSFVAALKTRLADTEESANQAHIAMAGVPMPEVQAKLDAASNPDDAPPGWSTPELTSLRSSYEEASAGAEDARSLVKDLRQELLGEAGAGDSESGSESGAKDGASGAADNGAVAGSSGPASSEALRFREEVAALISTMGEDASGASGEDAAGASGTDGNDQGASGASSASSASGANADDASGGAENEDGSASGAADDNASGPAGPAGPASVVTHVIKQGEKTVVTTTTFHNQEDTPSAVWEKVKHLEEHKCDDCDEQGNEKTNDDGATGNEDATGSATGSDGAANASGPAETGAEGDELQASEAEEFNARLSSMENALMGAISEKRHADEASAIKISESNLKINELEKQLEEAKAAAAGAAPSDPLAALKHIHSMALLTKTDGNNNAMASGNLTEHAIELKNAAKLASPKDVLTLESIAKRLETMGKQEDKEAGSSTASTAESESESTSTGPVGPPKTESEQLALIAKRLSNAIHGRSFGVTAQETDQKMKNDASGGSDGDASGPATSEEDMLALQTVALKLMTLVNGGEDASGASGNAEDVAPMDAITVAMEKLTNAVGGSSKGSSGGEVDEVDEASVEAEEMNDTQLEGRVEKLQLKLDELKASASGASGNEGEEGSDEADLNEGGEQSVEVPAENSNGEKNSQDADAAAGDKAEGGKTEGGDEANSATPDAPEPGDKVEPVSGGESTAGFRTATMVDRNTINQHLETQKESGEVDAEEENSNASIMPVDGEGTGQPSRSSTPKTGTESPEIVQKLGGSKVSNTGDYQVTATSRR